MKLKKLITEIGYKELSEEFEKARAIIDRALLQPGHIKQNKLALIDDMIFYLQSKKTYTL